MKKNLTHILSIAFFPMVLCYYEILFRLATGGELLQSGTWITLAACLALGLVCYLPVSISASRKRNGIIAAVISFVLAVPYLVEYFISRQFKLFYDLNTTFGGASDAVGGFSAEIYRLIFCWDGFIKITLYLIPTVIALVLAFKKKLPAKSDWQKRVLAAEVAVLSLLVIIFGLNASPEFSLLAKDHYSFQNSVDTFGLIPGVSLDLKHIIMPNDDGFEQVQVPVIPNMPTTPPATTPEPTTPAITTPGDTTPAPTTPVPTTPPFVPEPNQLDIDFSSLTTKGTVGSLNTYVASLTPSMTNEYTGLFEGKNLIFITAEAFGLGVIDPVRTPTLYRMATKGMQFTDYYQADIAGTTGGEYQTLFGMPPTSGGLSFKETVGNNNYFTMGSQLDRLGYWGKAYHNNDYTFYSRHRTHKNLGYSEGFVGMGNGMEDYVVSQWPASDLEMFVGSVGEYIDKQPFNVYYMTVSGHSNYTRYGNCMVKKHWDRVADLDYSDPVKGYLACQMELEDSMTFLLATLESAGIADDTVIVITGDHFPYGLDDDNPGSRKYTSELYGYPITNSMVQDQNVLIIWSGCLEKMDPIVVDDPTCSLDILPTLSNLFGTAYDSRLFVGRDVFSDTEPLIFNNNYDWKTVYGTYIRGEFTPASKDMEVPEEYVEAISAIVRNKIRYCRGVLSEDYFGYLYKEGQLD